MKKQFFTLLTFLVVCVTGVWASADFVIFDGTGSTAPESSKQTDATTGFAYTCNNFKSSFTNVSSYTNHGSYINAIRYGGGTTSSKNHIKLEIPEDYEATIYLVYGGTSTNTKWGISEDGTKPTGSNCSVWNATATASATLYEATIEDLSGNKTYYIGGSGDGCVIAYISVSLSTTAPASAPSTPTINIETGAQNGNTPLRISSTDATKVYYYWSGNATPEDKGDAAYNEGDGAFIDTYVENIAGSRYLHAYGYNGAGTSDIATFAFTVTKVKDFAGLAYATVSVTKNIGEENFTNPLTNPNSLSVTYSVVEGATATGVSVNSDGEVTIGSVAGTATIKASFAGNEDYAAGDATYTLTVQAGKCAKPTVEMGSYNYEEDGYPVTMTSATDGATIYYKLGSADYVSVENGTTLYLKNGTLKVQAKKTYYTDSDVLDAKTINNAPSITSPEQLIPFNTGSDEYDKNVNHTYRSVSLADTYFAGVDGSSGLKMRCNRSFKIDEDDIQGFAIDVNEGYKVTKVKFISIRSNRAGTIAVDKMYVDGVEVSVPSGFETIPSSSSSAITNFEIEVEATSQIGWKLTPGKYGDNKDVDQFKATIEITYDLLAEEISTATGQTFGTYVTAHDLDFSKASGISAYKITGVENGVIQTAALTQVPSGTPILIETASAGATVNVPFAASTPGAITENKLKVGADGIVSDEDNYRYVLAAQGGVTGFYKLTSATDVPANRAYLELTEAAAAPSMIRIIDEENSATNVENIESEEKAVKFIEDGQLYILREGVVYDALGRKVR